MTAADVTFSVVVPTRGDARKLDALLTALEAQAFPRERFELLLALDGAELSPDHAARVAALAGRVARLTERRGPGAARNAAAALATHDWLAFTEDDCAPAPDWLARAAERIARAPEPDVIEGLTVLPGDRPLRRRAPEGLQYIPTNLFVRRERFERVKGYCEHYFDAARGIYFREDADFGFALEEIHSVAVRDDAVKVTHPDEHPGFWDPLRWAARYEMDPLLERRHPRLFHERIEVHRVGPFRVRRPIVRACTGVVLALVLAAVLIAANRGPQAVPLLAIALLLELFVWSKWRFHPLRLIPALLVPFVMTLALVRGQARAARFARPQ
jgi:glycosyltransferase involved in cell wall biosynthesis